MIHLKTMAAAATFAIAGAAASARSITEIAAGDERFTTLVAAVTAAGLAGRSRAQVHSRLTRP
jgi:hypothetical protein